MARWRVIRNREEDCGDEREGMKCVVIVCAGGCNLFPFPGPLCFLLIYPPSVFFQKRFVDSYTKITQISFPLDFLCDKTQEAHSTANSPF